jgi:L-fucose isomerase-like protein
MSVCNNLNQYGIYYTLSSLHTVDPENESFRADLRAFAGTCKVVRGFKNAPIGAISARSTPLKTVRYGEKLFERTGISVETIDLSEIYGRSARLKADDPWQKNKLEEVQA